MWPLGTGFGVLLLLLGWHWVILEGSSSPDDSGILRIQHFFNSTFRAGWISQSSLMLPWDRVLLISVHQTPPSITIPC